LTDLKSKITVVLQWVKEIMRGVLSVHVPHVKGHLTPHGSLVVEDA
jgi:hypothetical protein